MDFYAAEQQERKYFEVADDSLLIEFARRLRNCSSFSANILTSQT